MPVAATMNLLYSSLWVGLALVIPAYQSFKALEKRHGVDELRAWITYWLVFAAFYVTEPLADTFLYWLPLYSLAKLAFLAALWHPSTQLAQSMYDRLLCPLLVTYEPEIDRIHADLRTQAAETVGQHTAAIKAQLKQQYGVAAAALKGVQQKALERAAARRASRDGGAGHGLHAE